jgi:hypothetical protein
MPTTNPRLSITLAPADLAVLDRYAAASGTPRASMVAALIKAAVPELDRAAELIELANAAPHAVVQGLVSDLSNATADAMGFLRPFQADYELIMNTLQRELPLDQPKRRAVSPGAPVPGVRAVRPAPARRPPPTNRGVKI